MSSNILNLVSEDIFSEKMDALIEAVGDSSSGSTTSSDGLVYEKIDVSIDSTLSWKYYAKSESIHVLLPESGKAVAVSHDGRIWKTYTLPEERTWSGLAYGNGRFMLASESDGNDAVVYTSENGVDWSKVTAPGITFSMRGAHTNSIIFYDGYFWMGCIDTYSHSLWYIFRTVDGVEWEEKSPGWSDVPANAHISCAGDIFQVYDSWDTYRFDGATDAWVRVDYNSEVYLVGKVKNTYYATTEFQNNYGDFCYKIYTSIDGENWHFDFPTGADIAKVSFAFNDDCLVAYGSIQKLDSDDPENRELIPFAYAHIDGIWKPLNPLNISFSKIIYNGREFINVDESLPGISVNGIDWQLEHLGKFTQKNTDVTTEVQDVITQRNLAYYCEEYIVPQTYEGFLRGIAKGNVTGEQVTRLVAVFGADPDEDPDSWNVGDSSIVSNTFMYSDDGYEWHCVNLPEAHNWVDICFTGSGYGPYSNEFIAIAGRVLSFEGYTDEIGDYFEELKITESTTLARSFDGIHWTIDNVTLGAPAQWTAIASYGGAVAAVAEESSTIFINNYLYDLPETMSLTDVVLSRNSEGGLDCTAIETGRSITLHSTWDEEAGRYVYPATSESIKLLPTDGFSSLYCDNNIKYNEFTIFAFGRNLVAVGSTLLVDESIGSIYDIVEGASGLIIAASTGLWVLRDGELSHLHDASFYPSAYFAQMGDIFVILGHESSETLIVQISSDSGVTWISRKSYLKQNSRDISSEVLDVVYPDLLERLQPELPKTDKYLYLANSSNNVESDSTYKLTYQNLCYNAQIGRVASKHERGIVYSDNGLADAKLYAGDPIKGELMGVAGAQFIFNHTISHIETQGYVERDEFGDVIADYTEEITVIDNVDLYASTLEEYQSPLKCLFRNEAGDTEITLPKVELKLVAGYTRAGSSRTLLMSETSDSLFFAYSDDGLEWIVLEEGAVPFTSCPHIVYGNNAFHANESGHYFRSYDGISWEDIGETDHIIDCAGGGMFVDIVGGYTAAEVIAEKSTIYWSKDGLNWNIAELPSDVDFLSYSGVFCGVCYFHNMFVLLPTVGNAAYSYDGMNYDWLHWGGASWNPGDADAYTYLAQSSEYLYLHEKAYRINRLDIRGTVHDEPYIPNASDIYEDGQSISQELSKRVLKDNIYPCTIALAPEYWQTDGSAVITFDNHVIYPNDIIIVSADPRSINTYADAGITCINQDYGKLIFSCEKVPSEVIWINIVNLTCFGRFGRAEELYLYFEQPTLSSDEEDSDEEYEEVV